MTDPDPFQDGFDWAYGLGSSYDRTETPAYVYEELSDDDCFKWTQGAQQGNRDWRDESL